MASGGQTEHTSVGDCDGASLGVVVGYGDVEGANEEVGIVDGLDEVEGAEEVDGPADGAGPSINSMGSNIMSTAHLCMMTIQDGKGILFMRIIKCVHPNIISMSNFELDSPHDTSHAFFKHVLILHIEGLYYVGKWKKKSCTQMRTSYLRMLFLQNRTTKYLNLNSPVESYDVNVRSPS